MNKPSERIVVFVTPAQKRAISATADGLGISISELMRRAVVAYNATSDQVRAASIVDRLNAPREPDALAQVLRKAAKPLRERRASPLRPATSAVSGQETDPEVTAPATQDETASPDPATNRHAAPAAAETRTSTLPSPLAAGHDIASAAHEIAQAVARLGARTPDPDATLSDTASAAVDDEPLQPLSAEPFTRATRARDETNARQESPGGGAPQDGKFA